METFCSKTYLSGRVCIPHTFVNQKLTNEQNSSQELTKVFYIICYFSSISYYFFFILIDLFESYWVVYKSVREIAFLFHFFFVLGEKENGLPSCQKFNEKINPKKKGFWHLL